MKTSSCRPGRTPAIGSGNGPSPGQALTGETRRERTLSHRDLGRRNRQQSDRSVLCGRSELFGNVRRGVRRGRPQSSQTPHLFRFFRCAVVYMGWNLPSSALHIDRRAIVASRQFCQNGEGSQGILLASFSISSNSCTSSSSSYRSRHRSHRCPCILERVQYNRRKR